MREKYYSLAKKTFISHANMTESQIGQDELQVLYSMFLSPNYLVYLEMLMRSPW